MVLEGGCQCGAVRYAVDAAPEHPTICHCVDCRRSSGAASIAWFTVPRAAVRWTGSATRYRSSAIAVRRFCAVCGTSLAYDGDDNDATDLAIATLDDPDQVPPKDNIFTSQQPRWAPSAPTLPSFPRRRDD